LAGKVALITGASGGIGRASALLFARRGARVALFDVDAAALEAAAADVIAAGGPGSAKAIVGSVSHAEDVERAVATTVERFGQLDVLVNNAGVTQDFSRLADMTPEAYRRVMSVNLDGSWLACHLAMPHLRARRGAVVNIGSLGGNVPFPKKGAYCVSKAAIHMLTQVLAAEEGPSGVRVNAIAPGPIATPMTAYLQTNAEMNDMIVDNIPLGRMGTPEETAELIAFLASDEAGFLSGAVIPFNGGMLALPTGTGSPYHP
jgi:NAD(P)-dependent dehydrogenase (short-subunit alcohol dehydrogenase family)